MYPIISRYLPLASIFLVTIPGIVLILSGEVSATLPQQTAVLNASMCGQIQSATDINNGAVKKVFIPSDGTSAVEWDSVDLSAGHYVRVFDPKVDPLSPPFQSQEYGQIDKRVTDWSAYEEIETKRTDACNVSVTLAPFFGPSGTEVTVTGSGWPFPGDTVDICWIDCPAQPSILVPVDSNGNFQTTLSVPNDIETGDYWAAIDSKNARPHFAVNLQYFKVLAAIPPASTTSISISTNGEQGNDLSDTPSISADGRYVVFESRANNLIAGDTNNMDDVFVRDRQTLQTKRISVATGGTQGNGHVDRPAISANGRYVIFRSRSNNLVDKDTNNVDDIFVHDLLTNQTSRVSISTNMTQTNDYSDSPAISANGHYVVFESLSTNLVSGDTNGSWDIFVHDLQTVVTSRVSVATNGAQANGNSINPSISADGNYIAFASDADNLVSGDTNGMRDIFVYDQKKHITSRVSVATSGTQGNNVSDRPSISADGNYISFESQATNLVNNDTNSYTDLFIHNWETGQTDRVSVDTIGVQGNAKSYWSSVSATGRYIAFASAATNLVINDSNGIADIFVRDSAPADSVSPPTPEKGVFICTFDHTSNGSNYYRVTYKWNSVNDNGAAGLHRYPYWSQVSEQSNFGSVPANSWYNSWSAVTVRTSSISFIENTALYAHARARDAYDNQSGWNTTSSLVLNSSKCSPSPEVCQQQDGWYGEYFSNRDLQGPPVFTRCDSNIDFYWRSGGLDKDDLMPLDNFSVKWRRGVNFSQAGWYKFRTFTDDGVRLYVDGERIIDDWNGHSVTENSAVKQLSAGTRQITMEYLEYVNDAIAHLTWYQCPNGASDCNMVIQGTNQPIPVMYQTYYPYEPMPKYCPDWATAYSPRYSLFNYGCAVTSWAMALYKYGVDVTPDELSNRVSAPNYFKYVGQCDARLQNFDWVPAFAGIWGKEHNQTISLKLRDLGEQDAYELIRKGTPLVMKMKSRWHFVLAVDVAKDIAGNVTFGVNDPWSSYNCDYIKSNGIIPCNSGFQQPTNHATLLSYLKLGAYDPNNVHYLEKVSSSTNSVGFVSSLGFAVSGAEMLLTDNLGHRVGFDPTTQQVMKEIPESLYFDSKILPPDAIDDGRIYRNLILADNASGKYTLEIMGGNLNSVPNFYIDVVGFDSEYVTSTAEIYGVVSSGQTIKYSIDFEPGKSLDIGNKLFMPLIFRD